MSTVLWLALIWLSAAAGFFAAALMNAARNADEEYETNTRAKRARATRPIVPPDMSQLSAAPFHPRIVSRVGKTVGVGWPGGKRWQVSRWPNCQRTNTGGAYEARS
jgi:hypothetical protein